MSRDLGRPGVGGSAGTHSVSHPECESQLLAGLGGGQGRCHTRSASFPPSVPQPPAPNQQPHGGDRREGVRGGGVLRAVEEPSHAAHASGHTSWGRDFESPWGLLSFRTPSVRRSPEQGHVCPVRATGRGKHHLRDGQDVRGSPDALLRLGTHTQTFLNFLTLSIVVTDKNTVSKTRYKRSRRHRLAFAEIFCADFVFYFLPCFGLRGLR